MPDWQKTFLCQTISCMSWSKISTVFWIGLPTERFNPDDYCVVEDPCNDISRMLNHPDVYLTQLPSPLQYHCLTRFVSNCSTCSIDILIEWCHQITRYEMCCDWLANVWEQRLIIGSFLIISYYHLDNRGYVAAYDITGIIKYRVTPKYSPLFQTGPNIYRERYGRFERIHAQQHSLIYSY